jgi:hypothetical protein
VCGLASRWRPSRLTKNACSVGASAVIASPSLRGLDSRSLGDRQQLRDPRQVPIIPIIGITGITPIPGLFRYLLPCACDGPVAWDDVLL